MSSTGQEASSTEYFQVILNEALADYQKVTKVEISTSPFAADFEQSNSPDDILQILQRRANAFQEYRDGDRKLISYLEPAVGIIQTFSKIIQEAVSRTPCQLVNLIILSGHLFTGKGIVCWDQHSP
jgi:predicted DsbA family dithiol-disulfide isomerase